MTKKILFFLLKLKTAALYKKEIIMIKYNSSFIPILNELYFEGFIQVYSILYSNNQKIIKIYLRFWNNFFNLSNLKVISKASCIKVVSYKQLSYNIFDIRKVLFISTSKGLKTQYACKHDKIGGKILFSC